ncbi:uncharacterized protein BDV17DRAFT_2009 [Aspergillus undulatus]|uniref:uncharacterized protein n=1 Tax=Aspergillus undulatus TaxID=1810928 RepID=UPI003CCCDB0F
MTPSRILSSASNICINGSRPLVSSIRPLASGVQVQVEARRNRGLAQDWKGSSGEKHTTHRVEIEKDRTDPQTIASDRSMKDREQNFGGGASGESDATTETGGRQNEKKVKKDHPKAPEPVIGMNDERAQKGV